MVDGWFLGDFFWKLEGSSAHTRESHVAINVHSSSRVAINVQSNYYMVEGTPQVWQLTCTVITRIWWRGAITCGSCVAINMYGNYYYMVEGSPHVWQLMCTVAAVWQLICTVITIWWRGPLMCVLMCGN